MKCSIRGTNIEWYDVGYYENKHSFNMKTIRCKSFRKACVLAMKMAYEKNIDCYISNNFMQRDELIIVSKWKTTFDN